MIKSKLNTLGFWMTPIMILCMIGLITSTLTIGTVEKDKIVILIYASVFFTLTFSQLFTTCKLITVDIVKQRIIISHYITRQSTTYEFKDIDGYLDVIEKPARGKPFKVIYLIQNGRFIERISSFIYSNIDEIEEGFKGLEYHGNRKYSYFDKLKFLFNRKIKELSNIK